MSLCLIRQTHPYLYPMHTHTCTHACTHTPTHLGLLEFGAWFDTSRSDRASSLVDCSFADRFLFLEDVGHRVLKSSECAGGGGGEWTAGGGCGEWTAGGVGVGSGQQSKTQTECKHSTPISCLSASMYSVRLCVFVLSAHHRSDDIATHCSIPQQ